jgi:protein TonB
MFEMSLVPERRGKDARLVRWIGFGSVAVQAVAVTAFIAIPLIYPDTLPGVVHAARMSRVELPRPLPKPIAIKPQVVPVTNQAAMTAPARAVPAVLEVRHGGMISRAPVADAEPLLALGGTSMGPAFNPGVGPGSATGMGTSPVVVVAKPATPTGSGKPLQVSSGVSRGLLIDPIRPVYPALAKAARQQGTVIVTAVIDRSGRIVNAQVVQGPEMLRDAAISAVRDARYHPYLLNGKPTEVETTITITFQLNA